MRGPSAHLTDDDIAIGQRAPVSGQYQLGDRFEVDRVGLDPAPALHAPLLSDLGWVELQRFPPIGPAMIEHRTVVMAGCLHT
jgi:hypothetical protein